MKQRVLNYRQPSQFVAAILTASLFAGCQPAGTGSIDVDAKDPAIRGLKQIDDAKRTKAARIGKQTSGTKSAPQTGFR
jgi:hypothetical protein